VKRRGSEKIKKSRRDASDAREVRGGKIRLSKSSGQESCLSPFVPDNGLGGNARGKKSRNEVDSFAVMRPRICSNGRGGSKMGRWFVTHT